MVTTLLVGPPSTETGRRYLGRPVTPRRHTLESRNTSTCTLLDGPGTPRPDRDRSQQRDGVWESGKASEVLTGPRHVKACT